MEEKFEAKMKWSLTEVGDTVETLDGKKIKVVSIQSVHWHGDRDIVISGVGVPTT